MDRSRRAAFRYIPLACFLALSALSAAPAGAAPRVITTFAGGPGSGTATNLSHMPFGVAARDGFVYVSDRLWGVVRRIDTRTGLTTVIAGVGVPGYGGDGGPATVAMLRFPLGIALDAEGSIFVADSGSNRIRRIDAATGAITTVAGSGSGGFCGDGGPATAACLATPYGVAVAPDGALYIADTLNHRIRKVASGTITTVAGRERLPNEDTQNTREASGPATLTLLNRPYGVAVDAGGDLYIADTLFHRVRRVAGGIITTIAGTGTAGYSGDGGPAVRAGISYPSGVAFDTAGNLYVTGNIDGAGGGDRRVRKIDTLGIITTVAGDGTVGSAGDGGPATAAQLNAPMSVATDGPALYIADQFGFRVRSVDAAGTIHTIAGNGSNTHGGDGGDAAAAQVFNPTDVAIDGSGNVYMNDAAGNVVRRVDPSGTITTVAGTGGAPGFSGDGGPAAAARLSSPAGIAVDEAGNVFIADSGNNRVRKVDASGIITTVAGTGLAGYDGDGAPASQRKVNAYDVAFAPDGGLLIADFGNARVRKVDTSGTITTVAGTGEIGSSGDGGPATAARLVGPSSVTLDSEGNFYIADPIANRVRKVDTSGTITTVAGGGPGLFSGDGGPATSAAFQFPFGVAVDGEGALYIADTRNHRIRVVDPDGIVTTLAGNGAGDAVQGTYGGDGGEPSSASLSSPRGVALGPGGGLFIADTANRRIRRVVTVDTIPPVVTIDSGPPDPSPSRVVTFTFTASEPASFTCALDGASEPCTSPVTYAGLADGEHTFTVRGTDAAGNTSAPASRSFTVDADVPDTAITAGPSGPINQTTATFSFTSTQAGSTFDCSLDGAAGAPCVSPTTYIGLAEGAHTFSVAATSPGGNTDPTPSTRTWTVDTAAPVASITSGPAGAVSSTTATFGFSSSKAGSGFDCSLDGGASSGCTSPKTYSGLADGSHTFSVTATDAAGNTSSPASRTWTVDTLAPDTLITSGPSGTVASSTASFEFASTESASFTCSLDGAPSVACSSPKTYANLPNGSHTLTVRARDAASNQDPTPASRTWTVSVAVPPTPVIASPEEGAAVPRRQVLVSGTASAGLTVRVLEGGAMLAQTVADAAGGWSYPLVFAEGPHTITAVALDAAANQSAPSSSRAFAVDVTAPTAPTIASPAEGETLAGADVSVSGTAEPSALVTLSEAGSVVATARAAASGEWGVVRAFPDGGHSITATAQDAAGNASPASAARAFSVDTIAPAPPAIGAPEEGSTQPGSVRVAGTSEAGETIKGYETGALLWTTTADGAGTWQATVTFTAGPHSIAASAADAANESALSPLRSFDVDVDRPTIAITTPDGSVFLPSSGSLQGTAGDNRAVVAVEVQYYDARGTLVATKTASCPACGQASVEWDEPAVLSPGVYTAQARAIDAGGNRSAPASITFLRL